MKGCLQPAALKSLGKVFVNRDPQIEFLKVEAGFDPIRDDPRCLALVRKVGFPE